MNESGMITLIILTLVCSWMGLSGLQYLVKWLSSFYFNGFEITVLLEMLRLENSQKVLALMIESNTQGIIQLRLPSKDDSGKSMYVVASVCNLQLVQAVLSLHERGLVWIPSDWQEGDATLQESNESKLFSSKYALLTSKGRKRALRLYAKPNLLSL